MNQDDLLAEQRAYYRARTLGTRVSHSVQGNLQPLPCRVCSWPSRKHDGDPLVSTGG